MTLNQQDNRDKTSQTTNQQKERQEQKQSSRRKAKSSDWQITLKNDVIFGLK
jgi:hypothetical protein